MIRPELPCLPRSDAHHRRLKAASLISADSNCQSATDYQRDVQLVIQEKLNMTIFKQISLCAILLFALASVGFAQELTTHEKSVKVVRAPSGSLELNPTDARVAEIEAARAIRLKTEI